MKTHLKHKFLSVDKLYTLIYMTLGDLLLHMSKVCCCRGGGVGRGECLQTPCTRIL